MAPMRSIHRIRAERRSFLKRSFSALLALGGISLGAGCLRHPGSGSATSSRQAIIEMENTLSQIGLEAFAKQRLHHIKGGYRNPFNPSHRRGLWPFLKWRFFSDNRYGDLYDRERVQTVDFGRNGMGSATNPTLTYVNHASIYLRDGGRSLLLDPVLFGLSAFIKDYTPLGRVPPALLQPDVVLVTHGHYDHLDKRSLTRLGPATTLVAPPGYTDLFKACGISDPIALDWFETCAVKGWQITCLPANHWTMRNPITGPNRALWCGFGVTTPSGYRIYISGDTAFFDGFDQIGQISPHPYDLAVFNLGAYEPRWFMQHSHLNPAECVTAFAQIGARWLLPIHWGSFRLGDEPVYLPPEDLKTQMAINGLAHQLLVLDHGDTWELS